MARGKRAIILAGGQGERLRPLTQDRPKPMVDVVGTPLLGFLIHWLRSWGYDRLLICCGYRHEVIEDHFGDGSAWGVEIDYEIESEPLGRGGALKRALERLPDERFVLALNGDMVTNMNLARLEEFHIGHDGAATLVSVRLKSPYGIVETADDSRILGFTEKPILPYWINAGIYVLNQEIADLLPDQGDHEVLTFPSLAKEGRLRAYKSEEFWKAVDTVKDVSELRRELQDFLLNSFLESRSS